MELVECLAADPEYWDFIVKGTTAPLSRPEDESIHCSQSMMPTISSKEMMPESDSPVSMMQPHNEQNRSKIDDTKDTDSKRWNESPLTLGAKMGLHEFVEQILKVCPQSAMYLDTEGRNILQVAIQNGQEKIVGIVESMATGCNPVLPSWLLSSIDTKTKNTILHFAAKKTVKEDAGALQMQTELQWFEVSLREPLFKCNT